MGYRVLWVVAAVSHLDQMCGAKGFLDAWVWYLRHASMFSGVLSASDDPRSLKVGAAVL